MSLEVGDIVTVLKKECEDPGWWYGELNGRKGLFPDNFVKLIPPEEAIQVRSMLWKWMGDGTL